MTASPNAFPVYLLGLGTWFVPLGIQMVLFPWLVAVVLHMDAFAVGVAQAALMAPALLFLPLGGLVADRGNPRRLLLRYHMLYAAPPLALAAVLMTGALSYPLLIAYGIAAGAIGAFAIPTRDALLPVVSKGVGLPRAVALATALAVHRPDPGHRLRLDRRPLRRRAAAGAACRPGAGGMSRGAGGCPIRRRIHRSNIRASGAASATASRWRRSPTRSGRCC